jgi:hypothetical protein
MKPKKMITLCNDVLGTLDMLEGRVTQNTERYKQVCSYIRATRELKHIARKETAERVTKEQVAHINDIIVDVEAMLDEWPTRKCQ